MTDWIEECKENNIISLSGAFEYAKEEVDTWLSDWTNQDNFTRAWLDGYEVEQEKRYLVKMIGMDKEFTMLKLDKIRGSWYLGNDTEYSYTKTTHTRKELEDAGFGRVFDCPWIEIEEVE